MTNQSALQFGIYPLSVAGTPKGLAVGPPDKYDQVRAVLEDLGDGVLPRTYLVDVEPGGEQSVVNVADRYREAGLLRHAVLGCLRNTGFELDRWLDLVRTVIRRHGDVLSSLQITNEPNLSFMDGSKPYVLDALVHGVIAAKDEVRRQGLAVDVGFGSVPQSPVALPAFWDNTAAKGGPAFVDAVDFVGHNFYVDVFESPVDPGEISSRVEAVLRDLRFRDLVSAGISASVPIRVAENGWPTGTNPFTNVARTYERQADVIDSVVQAVHRLRSELNISHYMLFDLRDADSSNPDMFHHFGIMRDDYSAKPAYDTFKGLVRQLSQ